MNIKQKQWSLLLSWSAVVLCMALIFYFSSRPGDASAEQSNAVLLLINRIIHLDMNSFIVRKLAHTTEFAGLGFLLSNGFYQSFQKQKPVYSLLAGSLYAATDEFHQLFVSGRACQIADWLIDTAGVCIGLVSFALLLWLIKLAKQHGRKPV